MLAKTLANYGAPYVDAITADNPETDLAADEANRLIEDTAQCTQVVERARCQFITTAVGHPTTVAAANVTVASCWGSGAGQKPVVTKTGVGLYTVTFAASFNDGLSVSESVAFILPICQAWGGAAGDDLYAEVLTLASNVITLKAESPKGTLADVGNVGANPFYVILGLR